MTSGRGGGGSPRGTGNAGGRRMGFLEAQIRRANGEKIPNWNNMTKGGEDTYSEGGKKGNSVDAINGQTVKNVPGLQAKDHSGLNPNRIRGFAGQAVNNGRVETPSLNEMRAKQGALWPNS